MLHYIAITTYVTLRTDMAVRCGMLMDCSENLIGICKKKKTNMTAKHGILKGS